MPGCLIRLATVLAVVIACGAVLASGPASASGRGAELTAIASPKANSGRTVLVFGARGQVLPPIGGEADRAISHGEGLAWSPDGREIAFVDPGIDLPKIMLVRADGSNLRELASIREPLSWPVFGPQGEIVFSEVELFISQPAPIYGEPPAGSALRSLSTNGSESHVLATYGPGVFVFPNSFAPNGTIAAAVSGPRGGGIAAIGPRDKTLHWIVAPTKDGSFNPVISPDGTDVVFLRDKVVRASLYERRVVSTKLMTVPLSGGKAKVIATIPGGARWPSWDPSGSRIAFTASDIAGGARTHSALMEINADGTCLTTVYSPTHGGSVLNSAWRPGPGRGAGPISCRARRGRAR